LVYNLVPQILDALYLLSQGLSLTHKGRTADQSIYFRVARSELLGTMSFDSPICAAFPRRAHVKAHRLCVSLNSRLEDNKDEEEKIYRYFDLIFCRLALQISLCGECGDLQSTTPRWMDVHKGLK
jgi:hypothetical protein